MARPQAWEDLEDYARKGHVIASIPSTFITRHPSLGAHLLAALAEAGRLGLTVEGDEIVIEQTTEERAAALASAQRSWDYSHEKYEAWIAGTLADDGLRSFYEHGAARFAKSEGLPLPDEAVA